MYVQFRKQHGGSAKSRIEIVPHDLIVTPNQYWLHTFPEDANLKYEYQSCVLQEMSGMERITITGLFFIVMN